MCIVSYPSPPSQLGNSDRNRLNVCQFKSLQISLSLLCITREWRLCRYLGTKRTVRDICRLNILRKLLFIMFVPHVDS